MTRAWWFTIDQRPSWFILIIECILLWLAHLWKSIEILPVNVKLAFGFTSGAWNRKAISYGNAKMDFHNSIYSRPIFRVWLCCFVCVLLTLHGYSGNFLLAFVFACFFYSAIASIYSTVYSRYTGVIELL